MCRKPDNYQGNKPPQNVLQINFNNRGHHYQVYNNRNDELLQSLYCNAEIPRTLFAPTNKLKIKYLVSKASVDVTYLATDKGNCKLTALDCTSCVVITRVNTFCLCVIHRHWLRRRIVQLWRPIHQSGLSERDSQQHRLHMDHQCSEEPACCTTAAG